MKYTILSILLLICWSCDKETAQPCEVMQKIENTRLDAKAHLLGKWKLIDYFAFRAIQSDPNIQLLFREGPLADQYSADITEDNKTIGTITINVSEGLNENKITILNLSSDQSKILSNGRNNFLFGQMRVCENQLLIDNGMVFDAPGFLFEKE